MSLTKAAADATDATDAELAVLRALSSGVLVADGGTDTTGVDRTA